MEHLQVIYYVAMIIIALLVLLVGRGILLRPKSKIEIREPQLIMNPKPGVGFGLSFKARISNLGDKDDMLTDSECFLYLEKGGSIYSQFTVGIRGLKDDSGYIAPQPIKAHRNLTN